MDTYESYVSFEVAKLLKEAGFDWKVMSFYTNDITEGCEFEYELRLVKFDNWNSKNKTWCDLISAPTLEVAQRWLREVKDYHLFIEYNKLHKIYVHIYEIKHHKWINNYKEFSTYEQAQEAGIKKCLEIILKKEE